MRNQHAGDRPFLESLFVSARWAEFDAAGWSDEERTRFLASQFALQASHYEACYQGAAFVIVESQGVPAGRLCLFDGLNEIRIVDISLAPQARGAGLGTAIINAVLRRASAAGKTVGIHVEIHNPARRLYRRLGFRESGEHGPYLFMEWRADLG